MKDTPPEGDRAEDLPKKVPSRWAGGVTLASKGARAGERGRREGVAGCSSAQIVLKIPNNAAHDAKPYKP